MQQIGMYLKLLTVKEVGFYGTLALIGSAISQIFGGLSPEMSLLLILMGADYVTGILASLKEGKGIRSSVSFWGLIRKGLMMLAVLIGHYIDLVMNLNIVMTSCIYFWYANEVISLTENYSRIGLPLPSIIKDKIAILKEKKEDESK